MLRGARSDILRREEFRIGARNRDFTSNVNTSVYVWMYTRYIRTSEENVRMGSWVQRVPVAMQFAGSLANPVDQLAGYETPLGHDAEMILNIPALPREKKRIYVI